jgi:hypothetical protein
VWERYLNIGKGRRRRRGRGRRRRREGESWSTIYKTLEFNYDYKYINKTLTTIILTTRSYALELVLP